MDLTPRDLDITVRFSDLEKVREMFREYSPTEFKVWEGVTPTTRSFSFLVNGVEVDVFGEEGESGPYTGALVVGKTVDISVDDFVVKGLTLEAEINAYRSTNREAKAQKVEEFIGGT